MQKTAVREEIQEEMCDGRLGACANLGGPKFNTRPLEIYTINDHAWSCPIDRENPACKNDCDERTCILRVEKVEGECATFRALKHANHDCGDGRHKHKYEQTDSFITIKIKDIAAVRCLRDTFVNLCIR